MSTTDTRVSEQERVRDYFTKLLFKVDFGMELTPAETLIYTTAVEASDTDSYQESKAK